MSSMQSVRQPMAQQFYNLENQYQKEGETQDPYKRLMLQANTLESMKELKEKMRNGVYVNTPKPYRNRAKSLFDSLENHLNFNERGEIYDKSDNIIPNSRVEDLIQHAVRDRRRNITPMGWTQFVDILRDYNVPRSVLNRDTLDEMARKPIVVKEEAVENRPKLRAKRRYSGSATKRKAVKVEVKSSKREVKPTKRYLEFLRDY